MGEGTDGPEAPAEVADRPERPEAADRPRAATTDAPAKEDASTPPGVDPGRPGPGKVVGRRNRKVDGLTKSTGQAEYTDDIELPGMLHGKILRSPHPHARIVSIDTTRAEALEGVHAVVTGRDMPTSYGIIPWTQDEYPLALEKVNFVGDAVAAVAAVDEDTAIEARDLIEVEYEELDHWLDPEAALEASEGPFIHEPRKDSHPNGNITKIVDLSFGEVDERMEGSAVVVEGDYYFEGTTHAPIEPHCAIGRFEPGGKLTLWSATQVPHYLHREIARVLELEEAKVRVIQPPVGGAFGGKSEPFDLEFCAAKLSMMTGRPVKILYTREEVFYSHRGRHPFLMNYRTGVDEDGMIQSVDADIVLDGGAYASFGLVTTYYSGQLVTAPYELPAYRFHSVRAYTNKPPCGPKRGHGSVQPRFAFEVQLDKAAQEIGMDPIHLRRINDMGEDTETVNELRVTSNGFVQCLDAVEEASGWKEKFRRMEPGRGVGVAGSCYISGTNYPIYPNDMPQSAARIELDRSGRVSVYSGVSEIGQGCDSMLAYVAAEELGAKLDHVRVLTGDTDFTPVDLGAYSSRVTFMVGNACLDAARQLSEKVREATAEEWGCSPEEVELWDGRAWLLPGTAAAHPPEEDASAGAGTGRGAGGNGSGGRRGRREPGEGPPPFDPEAAERSVPLAEAFQAAEAEFGTLQATGWYDTPKDIHGDYRGGTIGASPAYSFTAHVAQVDVDPETGFVEVEKIWVAHDCGKALNPVLVEGQMEGSAYMGFGEALMEAQTFKDADHGRSGLHDAPSLLDYKMPTSLDTPEMESIIIESADPEGPYGAKEAGEGPLHPSIPAIANAIYDAVGVRMDRMPFSPPRVWKALRAAGGPHKPDAPTRP